MEQFKISWLGFFYLAMLLIPNFFWAKAKPAGYTAEEENPVLLVFERVGEVLTTCCVFLARKETPGGLWHLWLAGSFALMLLYEIFWARYFIGAHTLEDFYGAMLGIPAPGASLPVAAVCLLGIYNCAWWTVVSGVILGIGHIGIHLQHKKAGGENYGI